MSETNPDDIPITTISRLFQTVAFEHDDTRITKQTLQLTAEYLKMFVREAILRADEARANANSYKEPGQMPNTETTDCLDVSHLEEISGLLVLDF